MAVAGHVEEGEFGQGVEFCGGVGGEAWHGGCYGLLGLGFWVIRVGGLGGGEGPGVHGLGLAGARADVVEPRAVEEGVEEGGFADVGAAEEDDFGGGEGGG